MISIDQIFKAIEERQGVSNRSEHDASRQIEGVASLTTANAAQVAFLAQPKYLNELASTQAGLILISEQYVNKAKQINPDAAYVIVKDAYLAYASISGLFAPSISAGIHHTAQIDDSAIISSDVSIAANAIIKKGVTIGAGTTIGEGVVIGEGVSIGAECHIEACAVIHHGCIIGDHVRIHSHANIGSEGFGFAPAFSDGQMQWQRIAQLGRVRIGNHVRIGSHTCIDRGAVDDTVIEDHAIIDNLVQIAHNVCIGAGTAIAAKVGIAGSTKIGKNCIIGGAVGISGHLTIADHVTLTGMTMVISDIHEAGTYSSGTAAMPSLKWRRAAVRFRQMGEK